MYIEISFVLQFSVKCGFVEHYYYTSVLVKESVGTSAIYKDQHS